MKNAALCVKIIVKESCKFELALSEEKKKRFCPSGDFLVPYFRDVSYRLYDTMQAQRTNTYDI